MFHCSNSEKGCQKPTLQGVAKGNLAEVAAEEKAAGRVLHTLAHLYQIFQDVLGAGFFGSYEAGAHNAQQIPVDHEHLKAWNEGFPSFIRSQESELRM